MSDISNSSTIALFCYYQNSFWRSLHKRLLWFYWSTFIATDVRTIARYLQKSVLICSSSHVRKINQRCQSNSCCLNCLHIKCTLVFQCEHFMNSSFLQCEQTIVQRTLIWRSFTVKASFQSMVISFKCCSKNVQILNL